VEAVGILAARSPDLRVELDVYGRGDSAAQLEAQAAALGLADRVRLNGRIPLEAVPAAIATADIGIAPTRRDEFTDISLSTKVFEYGAMAKPVVATALPTIARYFPGDEVTTYEPGSAEALATAIETLAGDSALRDGRVQRMTARVRELSWEHEATRYRDLVDRLEATR